MADESLTSTIPPAHPDPRRGFRIRWPVCVLWVLTTLVLAAGSFFAPEPAMDSAEEQAGYKVGRLLASLIMPPLVAFIPALFVFFLARRSTSALNITLMVMFILLLLVGCVSLVGHLTPR